MDTDYQWETVPHMGVSRVLGTYVTLRKNLIKLNVEFRKSAQLQAKGLTHVSVRVDMRKQALLLHFLTKAQYAEAKRLNPFADDLYEIERDGYTNKLHRGKIVQPTCIYIPSLMRSLDWLQSAIKSRDGDANRRSGRFQVRPLPTPNQYVVNVMPWFCSNDEPPEKAFGIYCFMSAKSEILYVGQGHIASRLKQHRKNFNLGNAQAWWVSVEDKSARLEAERHHILQFVSSHGRLPKFNEQVPPPVRAKTKV